VFKRILTLDYSASLGKKEKRRNIEILGNASFQGRVKVWGSLSQVIYGHSVRSMQTDSK